VQEHSQEIRQLGAEVLVVTQGQPALLAMFLREQSVPFPVVGDPTRDTYRAFGLERTTWWKILRPASIFRYLKLIFRGWKPRRPNEGEDVLQLGGDFILDSQGRLVYARRSAEPTDRPRVEELLDAIRHSGKS
jgi:peroxiredoxin